MTVVKTLARKDIEIELLKQDNAYIKQKLEEIHKSIVGNNGNPGLKNDVEQLKYFMTHTEPVLKEHTSIIKGLNVKLAYYSGAITVIVFLITYIGNKWW
jgi:hypothetical protein